ncbi:MAG: glycine oxidase ThiO [Pirellulales bacterium]|nr:glycine oxidase ThiO [Pirellulales bacterium]
MTTTQTKKFDSLIIGGGVIGLSLAWELAQHGEKVCVVDRGQLGREASWAGGGMLPPGPSETHWPMASCYEQLAEYSRGLHAEWHEKLLRRTDIDNQYHRCGALYLATSAEQAASLQEKIDLWRQLGIVCHTLDLQQVVELEPGLAGRADQLVAAYHVPEEAQIRNPRHLRALIAACSFEGVELRPDTAVERLERTADRVTCAVTSQGLIDANRFCLAAGCWTGQLTRSLGLDLPVRPIRGQIALVEGPLGLLSRTICAGMQYLVPRRDGRLLIGSTLEDVGFDKATTEPAIAELLDFAGSLLPTISQLPALRQWAGLRPGTADGLPYMGHVPPLQNVWLATGHYRAGLQLSPATAVVMCCLMQGKTPPIDVSSLSVERRHNGVT